MGAMYLYLRRHVENYCWAWFSFALLAAWTILLLGLCVPETLPAHMRRRISPSMFDPIGTTLYAVRFILADPVLITYTLVVFLFWVHFIGFVTTKTSYMLMLGFEVQETMLPELAGNSAPCFSSFPHHRQPASARRAPDKVPGR